MCFSVPQLFWRLVVPGWCGDLINSPSSPTFLKTSFTVTAACHSKDGPLTSVLKSIGHPKQEVEERWRRERGRKRKKGEGEGRKGKRTECDIWKLLVFPAGFQLCLLYCRVIVSNSKEDWERFLDKRIASLNKIKVLCVRKKKKTYSR